MAQAQPSAYPLPVVMAVYYTGTTVYFSLVDRDQGHVQFSKTQGILFAKVIHSLRVAKFDPKVGSRRTANIKNLVVLVFILVVLILSPYYMYVELVLMLLFLLLRER